MKVTPQQLVILLICFFMNMLDGMDVMIISYVAPKISLDWGIDAKSLGVVFSAGLLGMSLGAMFLAPYADKIGRKNMIMICNLIMGVSIFSTAWVSSLPTLIMMRIISGVGIGGMLACTATMASENAPTSTKDFWISVVIAGYPVGAVISGIISANIIGSEGWPLIFRLAGIPSFISIPLIYFALKESTDFLSKSADAPRPGVKAILVNQYRRETLSIWLAIFMAFAALYFLTTWIPKLASATGLSVELAIYAGTIFNLGAFFGIVSQGYLSSKFGLQKTIFSFLIFTAVLMLLFGFFTGSVWVLILFGLIGFGIQGGFVGMYSMAAKVYQTEVRATGVGWAVGAGRVGAIIGPFLGGVLLANGLGLSESFGIFTIPTIIAGIATLLVKKA